MFMSYVVLSLKIRTSGLLAWFSVQYQRKKGTSILLIYQQSDNYTAYVFLLIRLLHFITKTIYLLIYRESLKPAFHISATPMNGES